MAEKQAAHRRTVRLAARHRLQKSTSRSGPVLVSPNGAVPLNETAAAILALCDDSHTREEIVARVLSTQNNNLAADVREFLEAATRRGWIVER